MDEKEKPTTAASMESSKEEPHRPLYTHMVQNFLVVWLDGSINEGNTTNRTNSIIELRQTVNTVKPFTNIDECIDFITNIKEEKIIMVISGALSQIIVPIVQDIVQVSCVYIFCENATQYEQWAQQWCKVKGVFTDITLICKALRQTAQICDQNSVSISFVKSDEGISKTNLDELDQSFMYTQILKEILLSIDFEQEHINEFLTYCSEHFDNNTIDLKDVEKFVKQYHDHQPIWWYTSQGFLYSMLNRALRLMEVDSIIKLGFFLRNMHQNITALHSEQFAGKNRSNAFTVYRGQGLSQTHLEQLMETQGGLISFNNFLSTSLDRAVSLLFAESNQFDLDLIGILFEITVNPAISSTSFANVRDVSAYQTEQEILFSMHSVFRIGQMTPIDGNNRLWQVQLTLTSDNDPQLHAVTECIRNETSSEYNGWHRLGKFLMKTGYFKKAEKVYDILLKETTTEREKSNLLHEFGQTKHLQGEYAETITIYEQSVTLLQKTLHPNPFDLATYYNNIGLLYFDVAEYSKALSYHEKALEIRQKTLPPAHPELATSYSNIGLLYFDVAEYSKALSYYEKAFEIRQKTLPPAHPELATSYNNIGLLYSKMAEYSKALSYYEKAFEIKQKSLRLDHPDMATSYSNIGLVYSKVAEYSKALSYYEKALEIDQKNLPRDHPSLATSYNNIGLVYKKMGEYSKALSYYEKSLEIDQKALPPAHPDMATSYNNIGLLYSKMAEYSKALSYYEKALEIDQKTLAPAHPHLATSYRNIGLLYERMGEFTKAVSFYENTVDILQRLVPVDHPDLLALRKRVEIVKIKL